MWSNQILWMWPDFLNVAGSESFWQAIDNDTGTCFLCIYWIFGIQSVWMLTFLDLEGAGRNLKFPQGRKPWLLLGMEREKEREWGEWKGVGRRGVNGNFYKLINFYKKNRTWQLKKKVPNRGWSHIRLPGPISSLTTWKLPFLPEVWLLWIYPKLLLSAIIV